MGQAGADRLILVLAAMLPRKGHLRATALILRIAGEQAILA